MDIRDIGMVIRKARQLQGISQERLAEHGKVSKQTISNIEKGEAETSYVVFFRICDYLDIDTQKIMDLIRVLDEVHAEEGRE